MKEDQASMSIFISCAKKDERLLKELENHLSVLKEQRVITTWHYGQIIGGTNRNEVINKQLEEASIILLLVSADFLASDNYSQIEMQHVLERHKAGQVRVIPIIVRPCDWSHASFAHLQCLPHNRKAITTWDNRDLAWNDVIIDIREAIKDMSSRGTSQAKLSTDTSSPIDSFGQAPAERPQKQRGIVTWVKPLMIVVVALIVVSIAFAVILLIRITPKSSIVNIRLQVISQPNYVNVGGILVSYSLLDQNIELSLSFVNNGKATCTNVKFHALDLSISSGQKFKPTSSINQSWTLQSTVPRVQIVQFQLAPGSGSQYTLTLSLDVGGCATPPDHSQNRYATYQVEFSVNK